MKELTQKTRKRICLYRAIKTLILLTIILIGIEAVLIVKEYVIPPHIKDGKIIRYYNELIRILDEMPEYGVGETYHSNIPEKIRNDISMMRKSNELDEIRYYTDSKQRAYISISEYESGELYIADSYSFMIGGKSDNISFYKSNGNIVVLFTPIHGRDLYKLVMDSSTGYPANIEDFTFIKNLKNIDLIGTNQEYDDIWEDNSNMTIIRDGKDFKFYRLGRNIKTVTFPGGDIEEISRNQIIDSNNNLYYMYYSVSFQNPWINFVKVDSIDQIDDSSEIHPVKYSDFYYFPIYLKGDKRYVTTINSEVEETYGYYNNSEYYLVDDSSLDFTTHRLELCRDNVKYVKFTQNDNLVYGHVFDWYMNIYYEINGQLYYESERVDGLDSMLVFDIPEERYSQYIDKEVSVDEVDEVIEELKQIYREYE